jgi:hypothetical protein
VRMPADLFKSIEEFAPMNYRSLNSEIVTRLRSSIELDLIFKAETSAEALVMLARIRRRVVDFRLAADEDA